MSNIEVVSRTQKIIVESPTSVRVVNAGPIGPSGLPGPPGTISGNSASGEQTTPASIWIMDHNLLFFPAGVVFHTLDDTDELEPEELIHVSNTRILAVWPEPMTGKWMVS